MFWKSANNYDHICVSLISANMELKKYSCVFWILFMNKYKWKKIEIPEKGGSAYTGGRGVRTPLGHL